MRKTATIAMVFIIHLFCMDQAYAQPYFSYNASCQQIYQNIISLKLDSARHKIDEMANLDPDNFARIHLSSYLDFFAIFISEDEALFKNYKRKKEKYIDKIDLLPDNDPYKMFAKAEIKLHSAIIRSKFGELLRASKEILDAYKLLVDNKAKHPNFIYNLKSLSIIHSLIETVTLPGVIKKIFGIKGSIKEGLDEIEAVKAYSYDNHDFLFTEEVDAIYTYMLYYQANRRKEAIHYMLNCRLDPQSSLLATFLISKILQRSGHNEAALQVLSHQPKGKDYSPFSYLKLQEGICLLRKGEEKSITLIQSFIEEFEGRHFVKSAYQKLAWASLIFEEDIIAYKFYMQKVESSGYALTDDDKQAQKESVSNKIPDIDLLRGRLLYDGGYWVKAQALLSGKAYKYSDKGGATLEFLYRMGRIHQALSNYPDALDYYNNTIALETEDGSYYACNAALQKGIIFESQKAHLQAKKAYQLCLQIQPKTYKTSLHQKAKTALLRLEAADDK